MPGAAGSAGVDVTLTNSTVSGNSTAGDVMPTGGGISLDGFVDRTEADSIVAGNTATGRRPTPTSRAAITASNGLNIFGSDVDGNAPSDRENVPASLLFAGGLADNGGADPDHRVCATRRTTRRSAAPIRTLPRRPTSAARRGRSRTGTNPDIGAFELDQSEPSPPPSATTFTVTTTSDLSRPTMALLTLREALALADADSLTADRIEFAPAVQGQTIVLGGSQLTVNSDVTIDGGAGVTIDANQASRVLLVQGLSDVVLQHLTITGGRTEFVAANRRWRSPCRERGDTDARPLNGQRQQHCASMATGGGIFGDDVTLTNSTVSGNSAATPAAEYGGGYGSVRVTLTNSTVSGNDRHESTAAGLGAHSTVYPYAQ